MTLQKVDSDWAVWTCERQSSKSSVTWYQSTDGLRVAGFGKSGDSGVGVAHPKQMALFGDVLGDNGSTVGQGVGFASGSVTDLPLGGKGGPGVDAEN